MSTNNLSEELTWRGFVNQHTFKSTKQLDEKKYNFYFGVDPSADSMQIGNLAAAMMVKHFIKHGHRATLLVGGATGIIGDPDGKKQERDLKTLDEISKNKKAIADQYKKIFDGYDFEIVDNYDWFKSINYIDFLREVGKHVPMRAMLGRDFVQSRLSEEGAGISYAEFSYSLIQGYDFLHLNRTKDISLQVSGADQWGNSIAGVDLIRRVEGKEAHVWTVPLVVNKTTGLKFGKSEAGAVWLDSNKTSPFKFYQFWLNVDDLGVVDYLKIYTLLSKEEIESIENEFNKDKSSRYAQKTLAFEVTKLVHSEDTANYQRRMSEILFEKQDYESLSNDQYELLSKELPFTAIQRDSDLVEILIELQLASSKRQAREFIENGAVTLGNNKIASLETSTFNDYSKDYLIIKRGKKNIGLVKFI